MPNYLAKVVKERRNAHGTLTVTLSPARLATYA
jgi:hypothetical protein